MQYAPGRKNYTVVTESYRLPNGPQRRVLGHNPASIKIDGSTLFNAAMARSQFAMTQHGKCRVSAHRRRAAGPLYTSVYIGI